MSSRISLGRRAITTANLATARMLTDPLFTDGTYVHLPANATSAMVQAQGGTIRWTDDNLSGLITDVVDNGSGLCRITSPAHGLATGAQVIAFGMIGATAANGTFTVTVIDADTFDLVASTYAAELAGGAPTAIAKAAGLYRVTCAGHGLSTGHLIEVGEILRDGPVEFATIGNPNGVWYVQVISSSVFDLLGSQAMFDCVLDDAGWQSKGQWYATARLPTASVGQRLADGDVLEFTHNLRGTAFIQETGTGAATVTYYRD